MRYEVINDTITADDIHIHNVYDKEVGFAKAFVERNPIKKTDTICDCLISGEKRSSVFFEKWGIPYSLCPVTKTLSLSYAVQEDTIQEYFRDPAMVQFRGNEYYQRMIGETRAAVFQELLDWIEIRLIRYKSPYDNNVVDHKTKFKAWLELLRKATFFRNVELRDPHPYIGDIEQTREADVILAIDSLQSCADIPKVFAEFHHVMKRNGLLFLTTRNGAGMDILSLGGNNSTIYPYEHLTLLSPEGLQVLADKSGFEVLEMSTPGLLDCEFVYKHVQEGKEVGLFLDYLFKNRDNQTRQSFQSFLQTNNLSSHLRAVLRKK